MYTLRLSHTTAVVLAFLGHATANDEELDNFVQYFSAELDKETDGLKTICRLSTAETVEQCAADCVERSDKCLHGFMFDPTASQKCCFYQCKATFGDASGPTCCPDLVPSDAVSTASYIVPNTLFCDGSVATLRETDDTPAEDPVEAPASAPVAAPSVAASSTPQQCLDADACFGEDMPAFELAVQTILQERADALRAELQETYDAELSALAEQIRSLSDLAALYYASPGTTDGDPSDGPAAAPIPEPVQSPNQTPAPAVAPEPVAPPTKQEYHPRCYTDYDWADTACSKRPNETKCVGFTRCPCSWDSAAETCGADDAALQAGS